MHKPRLLFTAPFDFDTKVLLEYRETFRVERLPHSIQDEYWVCDPKANFIIGENNLSHNLKVLATPSTGTNHIDLTACARRGVKVISLLDDRAGLDTISASAEFTFKLLLDALRLAPARELQGKKVGILGYGRIGRRLDRWCQEFGAQVWIRDIGSKQTMSQLFFNCDVVIICCALTPETTGMITKDLLLSMKKGAALVNTARGEVIDEDALVEVMKLRPDLRVAVDVLVGETTGTQQPERLRELGAIVHPHTAGETFDSRTKAARIILNLLRKELENGIQSSPTPGTFMAAGQLAR